MRNPHSTGAQELYEKNISSSLYSTVQGFLYEEELCLQETDT